MSAANVSRRATAPGAVPSRPVDMMAARAAAVLHDGLRDPHGRVRTSSDTVLRALVDLGLVEGPHYCYGRGRAWGTLTETGRTHLAVTR